MKGYLKWSIKYWDYLKFLIDIYIYIYTHMDQGIDTTIGKYNQPVLICLCSFIIYNILYGITEWFSLIYKCN